MQHIAFLKHRSCRILTAVLLLQAVAFYGWSRTEAAPVARPLSEFPANFDRWTLVQEGVVEQEVRDKLKADDLLNRSFAGPGAPAGVNLFVAYFRSQRTGQSPHSPKNCLPGSGWVYTRSGFLPIQVPGRGAPVLVNRYIVSKGDNTSVVLYWYQSSRRLIASEYWAKFWLVLDAMRYNRSDTSMVRIWVPVVDKQEQQAENAAVRFVQSVYPLLTPYFPL